MNGHLNSNKKTKGREELLSSRINAFGRNLIFAQNQQQIYQLITNAISDYIGLEGCVLYKVNFPQGLLTKESEYGIITFENTINHPDILNKIDESVQQLKEKDYYQLPIYEDDAFSYYQEDDWFVFPIQLRRIVFGVFKGKYKKGYVFTKEHELLLETITTLAMGALLKMKEKSQMLKVKNKLEIILNQNRIDLDIVIDDLERKTLALEQSNSRQKELVQEVHHRVMNNLQTISSIIRLYSFQENEHTRLLLSRLYARVQILSVIYRNIYRYMEWATVEVDQFFKDIIHQINYTFEKLKLTIDFENKVKTMNYDTLVSLGLCVAEIFYIWIERFNEAKCTNFSFHVRLYPSQKQDKITVQFFDSANTSIEKLINLNSSDTISDIMITGFIEQLDASVSQSYSPKKGNILNIEFDGKQ